MAGSARDDLRDDLLRRYDKSQHPPNDVRLTYKILVFECPQPGRNGNLLSRLHETQVSEPRSSRAVLRPN